MAWDSNDWSYQIVSFAMKDIKPINIAIFCSGKGNDGHFAESFSFLNNNPAIEATYGQDTHDRVMRYLRKFKRAVSKGDSQLFVIINEDSIGAHVTIGKPISVTTDFSKTVREVAEKYLT